MLVGFSLAFARADSRVGSRFAYLDARDPYDPDLATAKLTAPM